MSDAILSLDELNAIEEAVTDYAAELRVMGAPYTALSTLLFALHRTAVAGYSMTRPVPPADAPTQDVTHAEVETAHDTFSNTLTLGLMWRDALRSVLEQFANGRAASAGLVYEDSRRLDWLDAQSWITLEKSDESDNNGVGLVNSAVRLRSDNPDGQSFETKLAATFREAIDAARGSGEGATP